MADRDLFDQLAELPGEPPSGDFVSGLQARLRAVRTDVGPATPTDQPIEGVVLMPEIEPDSQTRRRTVPLIAAAAAAVFVLIVVAVFASLDDEESRPVDVVTEPDALEEPLLPAAEAPLLEVAEAWMAAYAAEDERTFRDLHTANAIVRGSPFVPDQPSGTLNSEATAERYWGGWDAYVAFNDAWGSVVTPGTCEINRTGIDAICTTTYGMFGPDSSPAIEFGVILGATDGRISRVQTSARFFDADGEDLAEQGAEWDPEYFAEEITPDFQSCLDINWNSGECGARNGDFWIAVLEAFVPDALVRPSE